MVSTQDKTIMEANKAIDKMLAEGHSETVIAYKIGLLHGKSELFVKKRIAIVERMQEELYKKEEIKNKYEKPKTPEQLAAEKEAERIANNVFSD